LAGKSADNLDITLMEYDGFNQLKNVITGNTIAEYAYNPDGLRIEKSVNGVKVKHIWDGSQLVLEADNDGFVVAKYIRGINLILAEDGAGAKRYYLYNGHGDVIQLTDTSGNVIKNYDYDAFGNEKNLDNTDTNPFRYCGEYFDKETGTYYLRARYYDPTLGRFITEDSIKSSKMKLSNGIEIDNPLCLNLYTYAVNNPILFIDPSGHIVICCSPGIQAAFGYGVYGEINFFIDDQFNLMIGGTLGGQIQTNISASLGIGFSIDPFADTVNDCTGLSLGIGGSVGWIGGISAELLTVDLDNGGISVNIAKDQSIDLTTRLLPADFHVKLGYTWPLYKSNLLDLMKFEEGNSFTYKMGNMPLVITRTNNGIDIYYDNKIIRYKSLENDKITIEIVDN
jgi:RHS repeat-associated protein